MRPKFNELMTIDYKHLHAGSILKKYTPNSCALIKIKLIATYNWTYLKGKKYF